MSMGDQVEIPGQFQARDMDDGQFAAHNVPLDRQLGDDGHTPPALTAWRIASLLPISATTLNAVIGSLWRSSACSRILRVPEPRSRKKNGWLGRSFAFTLPRPAQGCLGGTTNTISSSANFWYSILASSNFAPTAPTSYVPSITASTISFEYEILRTIEMSGYSALIRPIKGGST